MTESTDRYMHYPADMTRPQINNLWSEQSNALLRSINVMLICCTHSLAHSLTQDISSQDLVRSWRHKIDSLNECVTLIFWQLHWLQCCCDMPFKFQNDQTILITNLGTLRLLEMLWWHTHLMEHSKVLQFLINRTGYFADTWTICRASWEQYLFKSNISSNNGINLWYFYPHCINCTCMLICRNRHILCWNTDSFIA